MFVWALLAVFQLLLSFCHLINNSKSLPVKESPLQGLAHPRQQNGPRLESPILCPSILSHRLCSPRPNCLLHPCSGLANDHLRNEVEVVLPQEVLDECLPAHNLYLLTSSVPSCQKSGRGERSSNCQEEKKEKEVKERD